MEFAFASDRFSALDPRKTPVQARSTATVDAILSATIQVLLSEGQERLTTTRVAYRAVSPSGLCINISPISRPCSVPCSSATSQARASSLDKA